VTLESELPPPVVQKEAPPPAITPPPAVTPTPLANRPTSHPGRAATIAGIAALGGALVAGGVLIYTYKSYSDLQGTASDELKMLKADPPTPESNNFFNSPSCNVPSSVGPADKVAKYKSDCNSGNNFAAASTGLWVATGVLAAGGVAAIIVGQVQASRARKERAVSGVSLMRQSLRFAPVFATTGGGVSAAFEF
jgi:hypothetical protein